MIKKQSGESKLEQRLRKSILNDQLKDDIRSIMENPNLYADKDIRERVSSALLDLLIGGSQDQKNTALEILNSLSLRTKELKQTFIEMNPGILVWEVNSYLAVLERHAGKKRDRGMYPRERTDRTNGIKSALDELGKVHGVDKKTIEYLIVNMAKKETKANLKLKNSLPNTALYIFSQKHSFSFERAGELYRKWSKTSSIKAEIGNRIALPGYNSPDFKFMPYNSNALRNCNQSLYIPFNPKELPIVRKKKSKS